MKLFVRIFIAVVAFTVLVAGWISFAPKTVRGRVIDSDTSAGIEGVTVKGLQRGWGWSNGSLVWDKDYTYITHTDADGSFALSYSRGGSSIRLQFYKDGYRSTKAGYPLQDTYVDYWDKPIIYLAHNKAGQNGH